MKKNRKVVRYRRQFHINIGVVVFAFVLIYFLMYLFNYLTANHIAVYEVEGGQITQNTSHVGLVLRTEKVVYSDASGSVNYYRREMDKVGVGDLVCSVDRSGDISRQITEAGTDESNLTNEDLLEIRDYIDDYTSSYSEMQFYNTYSFKEGVNAKIQEDLYTKALNSLSEETRTAESDHTFSLIRSEEDGVLAYYTDGYENVTPDSFSGDMYSPSSYTKINLKTNASAGSGQALYKLATAEDWYMLVPVEKEELSYYQKKMGDGDSFVLRVGFKKDDTSAYATAQIREYDGENFLLLSFNNSMIRFLADRYLEVELGSENMDGLKIPNSAIVDKEFLLIPKEYVGKGDDSSKNGVIRISKNKKGGETAEFIATDLYDETEDAYYISDSRLSVGDVLQRPESDERYTIKDTKKRKGVYNVNRGYAVFKLIEILAQNEEYTIVKSGSSYGIALYDHLALDGTSVQEGEMANERR